MGRWFVVALCATLGCGDNNATPGAWTSSDRYRADLYRADDVVILRGWYDAFLDLDCTSEQLAVPGSCPRSSRVFFTDSSCTQPWVDDDRKQAAGYYQGVGGYYKVLDFDQHTFSEFFIDGTGACRDNHMSARGYSAMKIDAATFVMRESKHHQLYGVEFDALESSDGSQEIISVTDAILVNAPSTGRLQIREYLNGGIRATASPPLFDRNVQRVCHPARDPNKIYRCAYESVVPAPPRKVTHDATCKTNIVPATFVSGYVIDETPSTVEGILELGLLHYRCTTAEDGTWFEYVDGTLCTPVSVNQSVFPCMSFPSDQFAALSLDRE